MSRSVLPRDRSRAGFLGVRARRWMLTGHVIVSVAWIGVSLCLLALGITGLLAGDREVQKAVYVALGTIATDVAGPVSIATLISGVIIAAGTRWGLFRHWWVLGSLIATAVMTGAVLFGLGPLLRSAAASALTASPATPILAAVGNQAAAAVIAPSVATVALSVVTFVNVVKPTGRVRRA